ncbi:MAG: cysteine desulfurase family protein [Aerococcus sp.]|nr:cysteine desulfurase family protein [Aerococcus sp.]
MIYFDNSATTQIFPEASDAMTQTMATYFANPSSLHRLGNQAHDLLTAARQQVAGTLGAKTNEIFFTSGGSESNNWAIKGTAHEKAARGKHLITSSVEHPSVAHTFQRLESEGFEVTYLPVDAEGRVNPEDVRKAIRPETTLVSVMAVNNEIGTIQPIEAIARILDDYPTIHFHVDGVQSVGKLPVPLIDSRVDLMNFSAHKFNGPRGVGILYKKANRRITPLIEGGGQEMGQRSTTENLAGIVATAKALRLTMDHSGQEMVTHEAIQQKIRACLAQYPDTVRVFSPEIGASPHVLCFAVKGVRGEVMVHALEDEDIYVSTTSACSSRQTDVESSTLSAMKVDSRWAQNAVRLSFGYQNTLEEADIFLTVLTTLLHKFSKIQ